MNRRTTDVQIAKIAGGNVVDTVDTLTVEEPLEVVLVCEADGRPIQKSISVTMRTPGDPGEDEELAAGFLFTEGIVRERAQIVGMRPFGPTVNDGSFRNVMRVELSPDARVDLARLERHFYTTSSCGVCGKASIDAIRTLRPDAPPLSTTSPVVDAETLLALPGRLREAQSVFERTGALHGAALFDADGTIRLAREDIGRHNAVDKVIGAELLRGALPARDQVLLVSGRAGFELVQKAAMAGIPVFAAVGAPSSLAVELAEEFGMTLVGFLRDGRFNVYAGRERVAPFPRRLPPQTGEKGGPQGS